MAGPRKVYSPAAILADAVGISHFVLANLVIVLGEFTSIFQHLSEKYGGLTFIFRYVDAPMYKVLAPIVGTVRYDSFQVLLVGQLVIVASSFVYGLIAYFFVKLVKLFIV